ncbi:hypothetical protein SAMN05421789_11334 [Kaistella chaponensis]|uniref:Uncharacterized protein n=1 Tax=Kaistella chaponensis TaxID=713588 RepID=A0A1N7NBA4_9FLAO|nr:hypothetical protein [Kaistella chaponensis]SIS95538.1 hypothetical protein SAMN05421789_11334 [Kaistella chaponensis]
MKKYLAIMFTVFYFGFSSGMVYNVHYCLDQTFVSSASSASSASSTITCAFCGTKKKKGCCKSEIKILKTDVPQKVDISFINDAPAVAIIPQISDADFLILVERKQFSVPLNAPPDRTELPLFISYCNFRI